MLTKQHGIRCALAALFCLPAIAGAQVVNGSFETFATSGTGINAGFGNFNYIYRGGTAGISGWNVLGQSIDVVGTNFWSPPAGGGSWTIDLVGSDDFIPPGTPQLGGVSQTVSGLTAGQKYRVSFYHAINPESGPYGDNLKPKIMDVAVFDGANALDLVPTGDFALLANNHVQYTVSNGTRTKSNMQWTLDSVDFTATGSSALLQFSAMANANPALTTNVCGPVLDLVTITAIPEPASLAILAAGGLLMLRRKRHTHG